MAVLCVASLLHGCSGDDQTLESIFPDLTDYAWPDPPPTLAPNPDWVRTARIAGADIDSEMSGAELVALLEERRAQNVSVVELDSAMSQYMTDAQFEREVRFLDGAAKAAHRLGMRAVIYYPSLEILTDNGGERSDTAAKEHPDWLQLGIDGTPNVFYGAEEVWVKSTDESAWMDPNGPWRDIYLSRVRALAATDLDGVWVDVPLYMDTGAAWPSTGSASDDAFNEWSLKKGLGGNDGFRSPRVADFTDPGFRAWIRWRHESLEGFQQAIADAARSVNKDFWVFVETFPVDYLDATDKGLDGAFRASAPNFTRVWEIDSVSNTKAMLWAAPEDFTSKIAMNKWARAADRENPTWVFSYGFKPDDAGLVMSAALASGARPFESRTPEMTLTVDGDFRTKWFDFIRKNDALLTPKRHARVGVWYSSATRDYLDYNEEENGLYGMYVTTATKDSDGTWWATGSDDSVVDKPHVGGWRGAANVLIQMKVPFKPILTPGNPASELGDIELLWLPSVAAMSPQDAALIVDFAGQGGVVLATGKFPGTLDELGAPVDESPLAELFGLKGVAVPHDQVVRVGKGLVVYRSDLLGRELFETNAGPEDAALNALEVERILRIHLEDEIVMDGHPWALVEAAHVSDDKHILYVVDFSDLRKPYVPTTKELTLGYRPPAGRAVKSATVVSPDEDVTVGDIPVTLRGDSLFEMSLSVTRFAIIELELEAAEVQSPPPAYPGPKFTDPDVESAAKAGLEFIRTKMRDSSLPEPWRYGVFSNLLDSDERVGRYAHGHLVTSEHMGLMLRASACMGDEEAYGEAFEFVREAMVSPLFQVVNWAIDPAAGQPILQQDQEGEPWQNGNAPLDDFRVIRGLIAGHQGGEAIGPVLAERLMRGMYWTSVTDRAGVPKPEFPNYLGGVVGYAFNFEEAKDMALTPPALARGTGTLDIDIIPVDYQDVWTMAHAARWDPRWAPVVAGSVDLMLAAEIDGSGRFYNGLNGYTKQWTGDFENPDTAKGQHLKAIQVLWTAIHLARASGLDVLDQGRRDLARAAAARSLLYFKSFYGEHGRIPEYFTFEGTDVPDCGDGASPKCLVAGWDNLTFGEARIYALLGRLALLLDEPELADALITDQIMPDHVSDRANARHGVFGASTADENDAEAWNVLESVLTLCLAAGGR